jgi:hypothetical protein
MWAHTSNTKIKRFSMSEYQATTNDIKKIKNEDELKTLEKDAMKEDDDQKQSGDDLIDNNKSYTPNQIYWIKFMAKMKQMKDSNGNSYLSRSHIQRE